MGYMTIDGRKVEFTDEPYVLSVACWHLSAKRYYIEM